jgi:Putative transposase
MTERAAHLVNHVIPDVSIRQWVLTLPHRIRYLLAWRHDLCKAFVRVLLRDVHRHLRTRACERGRSDVRGGAVAILQRFGVALNQNAHIHALGLDGVFARGADGRLRRP